MWLLSLNTIFVLLLAVWVFIDARARMNHVGWAVLTFFFGPIILVAYCAHRNLLMGEIREGGTGWNMSKYFGIYWTIMMPIVGFILMDSTSSDYQSFSVVGAIFFLWFFVLVGTLALGLLVKQSSFVEVGPTGPLADSESYSDGTGLSISP